MARPRKTTIRGVWWKNIVAEVRHCARCGTRLVRRYVREEKRKRHVCPRCRRITYVNPKVVAGLIPVLPDGRVLLLKRNIEPGFGRWSYPAGYQELGESVLTAARRETWEEVGVKVTSVRFLGIYSYKDAGVVTVVYVGKLSRTAKPRPSSEALISDFFEWKKVPWKELAFRSTREALKDYRRSLSFLKSAPKHGKQLP